MSRQPVTRPLLVVITDGATERMLVSRHESRLVYTGQNGEPLGPMPQLVTIRNWIRDGRIPPRPSTVAAWLMRVGTQETERGQDSRAEPPAPGQPGWDQTGVPGHYEPADRNEPCLRDYSYRWCLTLHTGHLKITTATSPVTDRSLERDLGRFTG